MSCRAETKASLDPSGEKAIVVSSHSPSVSCRASGTASGGAAEPSGSGAGGTPGSAHTSGTSTTKTCARRSFV
ncbi:excinuclease ABC subunit B [Leifsonia xyli subsp. cynodontis DSM 46306]|uniref:Uncharacterized protein n=1 Tax=Leifsonia xyli subsp. cynodontis DSM 46306 TaxID=1389489 RepID=U3P527_LEIXC|nr:excinuclease ABC subunit B [Leifsonia xyli subsp. cynodontis DSM 46306]